MSEELENEVESAETAEPSPTEDSGVDAAPESELSDLEKAQEENGFLLDQLQRARAEMANYRRRTVDQQAQRERRITMDVFQQIIPLFDDLHMALGVDTEGSPPEEALGQLRAGLELIFEKFGHTLKQFDIEAIPSVGEEFDPNWHEAMVQQPTSDYPEGQVINEFVRGYRMGDDLIRAARVIVAAPPAEEN